jgi:hypothetical protein
MCKASGRHCPEELALAWMQTIAAPLPASRKKGIAADIASPFCLRVTHIPQVARRTEVFCGAVDESGKPPRIEVQELAMRRG